MPTDEFLTDWLLRCCEIVDRYHPRILYFDWWIQHSAVKPYLQRFAAYYFNVMESRGGCVINYKHDAFPFGIGVPDIERGQFAEAKPFLWQSDTSVMRGSWCYSVQPDKAVYKAPQEIVQDLLDVVSKNGRLLLNFGPKPDGTLADKDVEILHKLADWMRVNDECIHGTGLWRINQEGPTKIQEGQFADGASRNFTSEDFRFTCRGGNIYAACMACRRTASCTFGLCARRTRATCRSGTALCGRWRCWATPRRPRGRATAKPCMWTWGITKATCRLW